MLCYFSGFRAISNRVIDPKDKKMKRLSILAAFAAITAMLTIAATSPPGAEEENLVTKKAPNAAMTAVQENLNAKSKMAADPTVHDVGINSEESFVNGTVRQIRVAPNANAKAANMAIPIAARNVDYRAICKASPGFLFRA